MPSLKFQHSPDIISPERAVNILLYPDDFCAIFSAIYCGTMLNGINE